MVFPVVMIVLGIVLLISGAYLINKLLQKTNHYRRQWLSYLAFIALFSVIQPAFLRSISRSPLS